ncbi:MAG: tetratricopeptide repeat protein [Spirochaetales bacterium]|nr:tetratricopeptide repeat protein [Spirochaetales bacterium]
MIKVCLPLESRETLEKRYTDSILRSEEILIGLVDRIRREAREGNINITVRHRVKTFHSWYAKLLKTAASRNHDSGEIVITDIMGIRIVCPFLEEVKTASALLEKLFYVDEVDVKGADYPYQFFGYESVHYLIRVPGESDSGGICEVQVRTILQEAWAEVEHELVYKSDFSPLDEPLKRKLAALNANLTLSDIMFQEIRDYQKSLHKELKKRRVGFYNSIQGRGGEKTLDLWEAGKGSFSPSVTDPGIISSDTVDTLLLKGLLAHNGEEYEEAVRIYSEILKRTDRKDIRTVIYLHRGMAYFTAGQEGKAMSDFNSALKLDPENNKARYYRAVNERMKGQYPEAFEDLALCLKSDPYNLEFLTARGETHLAAGDPYAAREDYRVVLRIDPEFKPAQRLLGELED